MVIPRAMVRDLAEGHAAAVLLSRLSLVMGAAPILAPTVGSVVLAFADWRGIFWILTAYGVACWALVMLLLPDTLPPARRIRLRLGEQLARYRSILRRARLHHPRGDGRLRDLRVLRLSRRLVAGVHPGLRPDAGADTR